MTDIPDDRLAKIALTALAFHAITGPEDGAFTRGHAKALIDYFAARTTQADRNGVDNAYAEFEGVPAKELAETVARYGKALQSIAAKIDSEEDDPLDDAIRIATRALKVSHD